MRIAQLVSNLYRIPPPHSSGTGQVVYDLVEGLCKKGIKVTLFAAGNSKTSAKLVSIHPKASEDDKNIGYKKHIDYEFILIQKAYAEGAQGKFDLIHSHFDTRSAYFAPFIKIPTISTLHSSLESIPLLSLLKKNQYYVSISRAQRKPLPYLNYLATVHHGIDLSHFQFEKNPRGDYFAFLGWMFPHKGAEIACRLAKKLSFNLKIAGPVSRDSVISQRYFQKKIKPYLNLKNIEYLGEISYHEKVKFLKNARGLLFPVLWEEPFGLVMIEAMACGTPVIALNRGSVPEIVSDKKTGFICSSIQEMALAIRKKIDRINREDCRRHIESNFSKEKMVENYLKLYEKVI